MNYNKIGVDERDYKYIKNHNKSLFYCFTLYSRTFYKMINRVFLILYYVYLIFSKIIKSIKFLYITLCKRFLHKIFEHFYLHRINGKSWTSHDQYTVQTVFSRPKMKKQGGQNESHQRIDLVL